MRVFEKWGSAFFQKSQIFKISSSSHSKNAHIKLIGFQWVFGGWGDAPFIFFMGRMGQKSKNGPSRAPHPPVRAVYPPGVGLLVFIRPLICVFSRPLMSIFCPMLLPTIGGAIGIFLLGLDVGQRFGLAAGSKNPSTATLCLGKQVC